MTDLKSETQALQGTMAALIASLLDALDTDGGKLLPTDANIARIGEIIDALRQVILSDQWADSVLAYLEGFDEIEADVLEAVADIATLPGDLDMSAIKTHIQTQVATRLMDPASYGDAIFSPLDRAITVAVIAGGVVSDLRSEATGIVTSDAVYDNVVQPVSDTATTIFERSATQMASDAAGVDIFVYQGRSIDTTREFCKERAGHAWHRKEIEAWADLEWDGKVEGTNAQTIFTYLGGWYGHRSACRHVLVPIAERDAPKEDLQRMRQKGLI